MVAPLFMLVSGVALGINRHPGVVPKNADQKDASSAPSVQVSQIFDDAVKRKAWMTDKANNDKIVALLQSYGVNVKQISSHFKVHSKNETTVTAIIPATPQASNPGGLFGPVVQDDQATYLLGSWHVMTNVTGKDGDGVFMPPAAIAGSVIAGRLIATPTMTLNGGQNAFDAAVAKIEDGIASDAAFGPGQPFGAITCAKLSANLIKRGAATQDTTGTIDGISEDIPIMYDGTAADRAIPTRQITILGDDGPFSEEGDSGALVCTNNAAPQPLGIIVGGTTLNGALHTVASPLGPVLKFYGLQLKTS
jgi:hypothetical protein